MTECLAILVLLLAATQALLVCWVAYLSGVLHEKRVIIIEQHEHWHPAAECCEDDDGEGWKDA